MGQSQMYPIYANLAHLFRYYYKGKISPKKYCQNLNNVPISATMMQINQYYIIMLKQEKSLPCEIMSSLLLNPWNQQKKL